MARSGLMVSLLISLMACSLAGCASSQRETLYKPNELRSPYSTDVGEPLWAVVPPSNASGTTLADTEQVGDALVAAVQQTRGLDCLPLDRTLAAMAALQMASVSTPTEAKALAKALGVDGLVIPTVTAWDPYDPPKVGITLALHARTEAVGVTAQRTTLNPRDLTLATSDVGFASPSSFDDRPTAVASLHLDARNHATLAAVRSYATGRHDDAGAVGWRKYVIAMPMYVEFAAHEAVGQLLAREHLRVAPPPPVEADAQAVASAAAR